MALVDWLSKQPPPRRVDRPPADRAGNGLVVASFEAGSAVVAGPDGDVALAWRRGDKSRERGLAPGTYRVRTTRVAREAEGVHWLLSSTGAPEARLAVKEGETARMNVDEVVRFEGRAQRRGHALQLGFTITGADGRGLSVYKDDRRVPVTYKLLDSDGKVLAHGKMNYG